jgi:uncharacterized damage-inducible protein DinB
MLYKQINNALSELMDLLNQLSDDEYTKPIKFLSESSIGEHTRHIIEMFQCLIRHYETGTIKYDERHRNKQIQNEIVFAKNQLLEILQNIEKPNIKLTLELQIDAVNTSVESNYNRELLYNLEHCIHHQALIKVAVLSSDKLLVNDNFGIANATIQYRKKCVQ